MQYVTLDTNAWINLANGTEPARLLEALYNGVKEGEITVILPTIIIDEWNKGKSKEIAGGVLKTFDTVEKGLGQILNVLSKNAFDSGINANQWDFFKEIASNFKKGRKKIENSISILSETVESIFNHPSTRLIIIKERIALKAGKFAIAKKAPFSGKNSFADALIVFSFIDYIETNSIINAHFITYNTEDFCSRRGGNYFLHSDLVPDFRRTQSEFHQLAADGINKIYKNINLEVAEFFDLIKEANYSYEEQEEEGEIMETELCTHCSHAVNFYRVDLEDERIIVIPGQLEFEFVKNIPTNNPFESLTRISAGLCSYCDTEYFLCASCGFLNIVEDDDYDTRKECAGYGCNLSYRVSSKYGDWHENVQYFTSLYTILNEDIKCKICDNGFWNDGSGDGLCEKCKDEYDYGSIVNYL
jgi:hypothetical protein